MFVAAQKWIDSPLSPLEVNMLGRRDSLDLARRKTPARRDEDGQPVNTGRTPLPPGDATPRKELQAATTPGRSGAMRSLGLGGSARRVRRESPNSATAQPTSQPRSSMPAAQPKSQSRLIKPLTLGTPLSVRRVPVTDEPAADYDAASTTPPPCDFECESEAVEPPKSGLLLSGGPRRVPASPTEGTPQAGGDAGWGMSPPKSAVRLPAAECADEDDLAVFAAPPPVVPTPDGGSVVRLEPVKASAKTSKALGTSSVLTPVRRSTRTEKHAEKATRELLEATAYAYVPNPVLPQPSAPAQPPGGMPAARNPSAVAAAVVALAKEADPEPDAAPPVSQIPRPVRRSGRAQAGKRA